LLLFCLRSWHIKVFLIGGTGFLGCAAAEELIAHGHEVSAIALPPVPEGVQLPPKMEFKFRDYLTLTDDEIRECFSGCEGFVFAAGADERITAPPLNITPLERLLLIAKECGVKHTVICGTYFSYFDRKWPHMELSYWHPFIRNHREQEETALSLADDNFNAAVLEFPYIFGVQQGREPVWTVIVKALRGMNMVTMYPKGGTTMITRNQAAQAIAGALEKTKGAKRWPIGCYNMPWKDFLAIVHKNMGMPERLVMTIPDLLIKPEIKYIEKKLREGSDKIGNKFYLPKFLCLQSAQTYIDRIHGCNPLGVKDDDIENAIGESIRLSVDFLDGKTGR
jgi:nucleoside-diphosphate-sugar epimerase